MMILLLLIIIITITLLLIYRILIDCPPPFRPFRSRAQVCLTHGMFMRTLAGYRPKTIRILALRLKHEKKRDAELVEPPKRIPRGQKIAHEIRLLRPANVANTPVLVP